MIKMISKNEHIMTSFFRKDELVAVITANQLETVFFLYEYNDGEYRKLGKSESPLELERKYRIPERMGLRNDE